MTTQTLAAFEDVVTPVVEINKIAIGYAEKLGDVLASGWAAPWTRPILAKIVGARIIPGRERDDGWLAVEFRSYSTAALAAQISGLVEGLEIVEPGEIKTRLAEIGSALTERYGSGNPRA